MAIDIECPGCGEDERLSGRRRGEAIAMVCASCGHHWSRDLAPVCDRCGSRDMQEAVLAIVEKSRGTQLSVVGTRKITLCTDCDASTLERYHRNRPNPLLPDELPTIAPGERDPA